MDNGFYLIYVKDNNALPVLMTEDQVHLLQVLVPSVFLGGKVKVVENCPIGKAYNILEKG